MPSQIYVAQVNALAVTGAITLVQIKAGAGVTVKILFAWIGQSNVSIGTMQRIQINRKSAAATVTSFTPLKTNPADASAASVGGTAATGTNASAEGTDTDILVPDTFNLLLGWLWAPNAQGAPLIVEAGGIIGLKFPSAPSASLTCSGGFIFQEDS